MKHKFIRHGDVLVPATKYDLEYLSEFKNGEAVDVKISSNRGRSIKMHRMYWALVRLASDYWESDGGFISKDEKEFAKGISEYVKSMGHDASAIESVMKMYMKDLIELRRSKIPDTSKSKSLEVIHAWIKKEAGYYDLIKTPDGLIKSPKSISFNSMSHERWLVYYKQAFDVVWNFILSKVFKNKEEVNELIDRLSRLG